MKRFELPNGTEIFHLRRAQTMFLYKEIFLEKAYLPSGIKIDNSSIVFDVGASIGMASLFFFQGFNAEIYSFEPVPESYEVLCANFEKSCIKGRTFPVAISDDDGPAEITYYPRLPGHSGFYFDSDAELAAVKSLFEEDLDPVEAEKLASSISCFETRECMRWTLSHAIKESGVGRIDLLKIDVEGSELDVLKGIGEHDWGRIGQIVAEIHDVENRIESACSILSKQGFSVSVVEFGLQGRRDGILVASRNTAS